MLSDDELKLVWGAAEGIGYPFGHIVQLLILTVQRRNEVAMMRWADIDWKEASWTIPAELTKADRAHKVPLSKTAIRILKKIPKTNDKWVFPARGPSANAFSGFSKSKKRLVEICDVHDWRLHDLRRTATSGMSRLGVELHIIQRVLNHAAAQIEGVTALYNQYDYLDQRRDAMQLWDDHVGVLVK